MSSAICFNLDQSKILSSGNWLNRVFSIISIELRETLLTVSVSTDKPVSIESERVRVVSLGTKEISEIMRLRIRSSRWYTLRAL